MTVAELEERMSARELVEWRTYFDLGADDMVMGDLRREALGRLEQRTRRKRG